MNEQQARLHKLQGYLNADSNNLALLMDATDLSMQLGDWSTAKELVERTLTLQPNDAVTRYRLAVILLHLGQAQESVPITQSLIDAGKTHGAVRFAHAQGLALTGRFAEAEPIFTALLSKASAFREFPYLYIRTLHFLGKIEEALTYANIYAAEQPQDSMVQGLVSLLYLDNDNVEQAAQWSAKALAQAPNNLYALVAAGFAALAYEDEAAAKAHFDKATVLQPNNGRAWAGKGLVNMLDTDLDAAKGDFEKAIEYMPTHLGSYNVLAWIQIMQRDYVGAKQALGRSMEVDPTFGETHGGLAVIAAMQGEWEQAKRLADTAIKLQSDSFAGQFAKSLVMTHRGHPGKAQAMVEMIFTNFMVPSGGNLKAALQRYITKQHKKS